MINLQHSRTLCGPYFVWGESERTPVNIVKKGSFRYTGFQYTLLLVDYDTICYHSSTGNIDEECDMGGERHLLSNNADIEATINNANEHFLYEESFREEQKICEGLRVKTSGVGRGLF